MDKLKVALLLATLSFLVLASSSESDSSFAKWVLKEKCSGHATVQCILTARSELDKWLEENNRYTILVAGKMGTGKTTVIKGFTENYMHRGNGNDSLLAHTIKVAHYRYEYEGVKLSLFDTPGLRENDDSDLDYKYLEDMVEHEISPNLIVFTIKMDSAAGNSLPAEDEYVMKCVSDKFGSARWKFAMFVLTFANKVYKEEGKAKDFENKHYFVEVWNKFRFQIRTSLKSFHVQDDVVNNIPIIPIGFLQQPVIEADERKISWVDDFWSNSFMILQKSQTEEKLRMEEVKKNECCACLAVAVENGKSDNMISENKDSEEEHQGEDDSQNIQATITDLEEDVEGKEEL